MNKNNQHYWDWLEANEEDLFDTYVSLLDHEDAPEYIYEGVCDDDYPDAFEQWTETLEWRDVPDDFLFGMYEEYRNDM